MLRKHKTARLVIFTPLVIALFVWMIPNVFVPFGVTTYDYVAAGTCRDSVESAVKVFADRSDKMDYQQQDSLIATDMAANLTELRTAVADAHCPSYSESAKAELLDALDQTIAEMSAIAHGKPADFELITKSFAFTREKLDALRQVLGTST